MSIKRLTLGAVAVLFALISCGGPKYQYGVPKSAPDWVKSSPTYEDAYSFIGVSAPKLSTSMSRTQAESRGRAGIGRILESRVSQMAKDFMEAATEGSAENLEVSEQQYTQTVARSVSKQTLNEAQIKDYWTNPKTGETYALVVLRKESTLPEAKNRMLEEARKNRLYGEHRTNKALEEMDKIIDKEYKESVPAGKE